MEHALEAMSSLHAQPDSAELGFGLGSSDRTGIPASVPAMGRAGHQTGASQLEILSLPGRETDVSGTGSVHQHCKLLDSPAGRK